MAKIPVFLVQSNPIHYYPLALGLLKAYTLAYQGGALKSSLQFFPILEATDPQALRIASGFGPGVWLFSNYLWSLSSTMRLSQEIKALDPRNLTIHGGPSCPRGEQAGEDFMTAHPHVDILVLAEGELTIAELLAALADGALAGDCRERLETVKGILYRAKPGVFRRTEDRARVDNLNDLPSPYLTGLFDKLPGWSAIVETNRGCPYGCTFCDWGALTQQKIKQFDLERVKAELEWTARHQSSAILIADANFGIFERDLEIAQHIVSCNRRYGYPKMVAPTFAKNITDRVVDIVRLFRNAGICSEALISIQTSDPQTLANIGRSNIKTVRYDELLTRLRQENLPVSTDLMVGLPGQTVDSFKKDLQIYFDKDVRVQIWPTLVLPNSPMAERAYQEKFQVEVDAYGFVRSTISFTQEQRLEMLGIRSFFLVAENFGYLRYVLRYLQWDHGIAATDFLHELWLNYSQYPALSKFLELLRPDETFNSGEESAEVSHYFSGPFRDNVSLRPDDFYIQVEEFIHSHFKIPRSSGLAVVLRANQAVMPDPNQVYPLELQLDHDIATYFADGMQSQQKPLHSYPGCLLTVDDPDRLSSRDLSSPPPRGHAVRELDWELPSQLSNIRWAPVAS